eukprot:65244_1
MASIIPPLESYYSEGEESVQSRAEGQAKVDILLDEKEGQPPPKRPRRKCAKYSNAPCAKYSNAPRKRRPRKGAKFKNGKKRKYQRRRIHNQSHSNSNNKNPIASNTFVAPDYSENHNVKPVIVRDAENNTIEYPEGDLRGNTIDLDPDNNTIEHEHPNVISDDLARFKGSKVWNAVDLNTKPSELPRISLIPQISRKEYIKWYNEFAAFLNAHHFAVINPDVVLVYLNHLKQRKSAATISKEWSGVKQMVFVMHEVNLLKNDLIQKVISLWLKDHTTKKSLIFTRQQYEEFLDFKANTPEMLQLQANSVIGWNGALRAIDYTMMHYDKIDEEHEGHAKITRFTDDKTGNASYSFYYYKFKTKAWTEFWVSGGKEVDILDRYNVVTHAFHCGVGRFCWQARCSKDGSSKHHAQPTGKGWYYSTCYNKVASLLGLKNPHLYTGHSMRASSASAAADEGATMIELQAHGGWKSQKVAKSYVRASKVTKRNMAKRLESNVFNDCDEKKTSRKGKKRRSKKKHSNKRAKKRRGNIVINLYCGRSSDSESDDMCESSAE